VNAVAGRADGRIVVIGAGVIGAAIARWLAAAGGTVVVLEAGAFADGASGANMGQLSLTDREPAVHLDLARESLEQLRGETEDIGFRADGGSIALTDPAQVEPMRELVRRQRARGLEVKLLEPEEVRSVEPHLNPAAVFGLAYCPHEGQVDPLALTGLYLRQAEASGAVVHWRTPVTEWVVASGRVMAAVTPAGAFRADVFVLATGAWTREVAGRAGVDVPIGYHRGAVVVTQPVPPAIRGPVVGGGFLTPSFISRDHVEVGLLQRVNGSVLIGQSTRHVEGYDCGLVPGEIASMVRNFLRFFPVLDRVDAIRAWAGVTPFTSDRLAVFGFCRNPRNLFIAAAFKGAFSVAPAVGRHAAEAIARGRAAPEFAPFSPARFGV
jgi:sarcosine oxidase subunit beta